jgi:hypothetical protein
MTQLTIDSSTVTVEQLRSLSGPTRLCDAHGRILGEFWPQETVDPVGFECPLSEEEIRCREQEPVSYSTAAVLERLRGL